MYGFQDNEPDMTSPWILRQESPPAKFHDGFWKSDHDFPIVFHSNFSSVKHGFRDNEVLLQAGYDVIVISLLGGLQASFHDELWKSDNDIPMTFYTNFLSRMHSFRDNEVSLQAGYDVIVISTLGGASGKFWWQNLKERPWLPDSVPYQLFI